MPIVENTKPTIKVFYSGGLVEYQFRHVLLGIEEEGVPCDVQHMQDGDALKLATEACNESVLGVGIGITGIEAVLHFNKLPEECPLFDIPMSSGEQALRTLGANAARLVKKLPLKTA